MISIKQLVDQLNNELNSRADALGLDVGFKIYSDFGDYVPPTYEKNIFTKYIQGVAMLTASALVPVKGLKIATETLTVSIVLDIEKGKNTTTGEDIIANESEIEGVKSLLNEFLGTSSASEFSDESEQNTTYTVALYGSQLQTQLVEMRSALGTSVEFTFYLYYSFVENGINSSFITVTVDGESVFFTQAVISRTPAMDGGAFDGTDGTSRNYPTVSGFEVDLTFPALQNSAFSRKAMEYLLTGIVNTMSVTVEIQGVGEQSYTMIFAPTHITVQGIENAGLSAKMVEYLEV